MQQKILVTGSGGPAGYSFMRSPGVEAHRLYAADMDPTASGQFLVPPERRLVVPRGDAPEFVEHLFVLCRRLRIDVLVPTVDAELLPLARARSRFEEIGTRMLLSGQESLEACLDKYALMEACRDEVPLTPYTVLDESFDAQSQDGEWAPPFIVKPRRGSGSRGIVLVRDLSQLNDLPRDGSLLVQGYLPGEEYSVDVLRWPSYEVGVAVPRARLRTDSGVAVASVTRKDPELIDMALRIADALDIVGVANVQLRRDAQDRPRLLEVNPRFPGTMPLTVAAGVNMPRLALRACLGQPISAPESFEEVGIVRTWQEHLVPVEQLDSKQTASQSLAQLELGNVA